LNFRELAQYKDSQWMSFDDFEKQLDDLEKTVKTNFQESNQNNSPENSNSEDSDDDANELYCVACNKSFKSDKA
jgi:DnaJ family protein A protein 5